MGLKTLARIPRRQCSEITRMPSSAQIEVRSIAMPSGSIPPMRKVGRSSHSEDALDLYLGRVMGDKISIVGRTKRSLTGRMLGKLDDAQRSSSCDGRVDVVAEAEVQGQLAVTRQSSPA